jgi:large subunit ribosomal protein L25
MELQAEPRTVRGKTTKKLRQKNLIPAEFYGRGFKNQTLSVTKTDFDKVLKEAGESTIITLVVGGEKHPSLIHDIQYHPISGEVIHADFYGVRMDEKTTAHVPIEFTGEAPAVKAHGGVLNKAVSEIEVEALPADLPHSIEVDLGGLTEIDQSIYIRDIVVPPRVEFLLDPETVVVTVTPPVEEEEPVVAEEEVDVSAVKVESEEKKAERDAEKQTGAKQGPEEKDAGPSPQAEK